MTGRQRAMHSRSASHESSSSSSSAHRLILEHILSYPGTYELPLRSMYALNSAQQPPRPRTPGPTVSTTRQFTSSLMAEISQLHQQPVSLPPAFIISFVRKCFASELSLVDFPQALTALDYLKDLETRRIREVQGVLHRLDVTAENVDNIEETLHPEALTWFVRLDDKTKEIEALYNQIYLALRRWILVNEMYLDPFNKANCLAMLNTVYPPMASTSPTHLLTPALLRKEHDKYFRYIINVEKRGPSILASLLEQGKRDGESTGWPATRELLEAYLTSANNMIDECITIHSVSDVKRHNRKVDSGVSFLGPRKNSSASDKSTSPTTLERPVTKSSSTLEKLARELRHLKRNKTDVSEMVQQADFSDSSHTDMSISRGSMRKMKSLSSLNLRRSGSRASGFLNPSSKEIPKFDADAMKKHRMAYEGGMMAAAG